VFALVFLKGLGIPETVFFWILFSLLIVISVYDQKNKIIPDHLSAAFALLAFVYIFTHLLVSTGVGMQVLGVLALQAAAGLLLAAPLAAMWYFSGGTWMGLGDAKLTVGIGVLLGFSGGIAALMIAFWIGALWGVPYLLLARKKMALSHEMPFGPFLALGTFLVFLFEIDLQVMQSVLMW
jgi:leader peptidase (prepilin peptidase) / N-methyltransferase